MNGIALQIGIELGLVVLLATTLLRAWRLERALGQLRHDRGALDALVTGFRGATESAEQSVARLRQAGTETGRDLARRIEHAGSLREDLGFITQRAEAAADRLEHLVREARGSALSPNQAPGSAQPGGAASTPGARLANRFSAEDFAPSAVSPPEPAERPRSAAERDLLRALKLVR
ncbi:MAG: hypothetical protein KGK10_02680 [Rhodospirillales bacterium]|nr:hypothetical protein [Rhodospirillales bacterium]